MRDPIVVLGAARSGTSMVAGLFARHGAWTGRCREPDEYNERGYFENLDLKRVLIDRWGHLKRQMEVGRPQDGFREEVLEILRDSGYDGGPWCMKHGALYWRAWHEFDPTFVCVYRNPRSVLESGDHGNFIRGRETVALAQGTMEEVVQCEGGTRADSERLIEGHYTQIREAFAAAGMEFDEDVADEWVEPSLWHH